MTAILAFLLFTGFLPCPEFIPLLERDCSLDIDITDGSTWVRILEQDYVFLKLTADGNVSLTAYDIDGEILAGAEYGEDLFLSAFNDYWFYILIEGDRCRRVVLTLEEEPPQILSPEHSISDAVPRNRMGRHYAFTPDERGRWVFNLEGYSRTDLDLELYSPGRTLWGGSYELEGDESISCQILETEDVIIIVSRYNKSGDGTFTLSTRLRGTFRTLKNSYVGVFDSGNTTERILVPARDQKSMLLVSGEDVSADIDLTVVDCNGEHVFSSAGYSSREAILLSSGSKDLVAEVNVFDPGSGETLRYQLVLITNPQVLSGIISSTVLEVSSKGAFAGFCPGTEGIYRLRCEFDESTDGDVEIFRSEGAADVIFSSEQNIEEFLIWIGAEDTLWVEPCVNDPTVSTTALLNLGPHGAPSLIHSADGHINSITGNPADFYYTRSESGSTFYIELQGEEAEEDLDMFVSGPGGDILAEGWISSVDQAGDESVAIYTTSVEEYGITVYGYDRKTRGGYRLEKRSIPDIEFPQGSSEHETWAVLVGISGYAGMDALNRCSMDAVEIYEFLVSEQNIPADYVRLLVDRAAGVEPVVNSLEEMLDRAGPEDRVIFYFSGHGNQYEPGSGGDEEPDAANESICLFDGDLDDDQLCEIFSNTTGAEILLFFDACHSGGFINDFRTADNLLVLTAAAEDNSVSERILTPILLDAFSGSADSNGDGEITAGELVVYVEDRLDSICPVCDADLQSGVMICPECGAMLKGENAVPHPEQGMFIDKDTVIWKY